MINEDSVKDWIRNGERDAVQTADETIMREAEADIKTRRSKLSQPSPFGDRQVQGMTLNVDGRGKNYSVAGHFDVQNDPMSTFSVCFWMKPFCYAEYIIVLSFDNFFIQLDEGHLVAVLSGMYSPFNTIPELQSWSHFCVSVKNSELEMYHDGQPVDSLACTTFSDISYSPLLKYVTIGYNYSGSAYCGYLAGVTLFQGALTLEQAQSIRLGQEPDGTLQSFDVIISKVTSDDDADLISSFPYSDLMKPKHNYSILTFEEQLNFLQSFDGCVGYGGTLPVLENGEHRVIIADYLLEHNVKEDWWVLITNNRSRKEFDNLCPAMYTETATISLFLWGCRKRVSKLKCVIPKGLFLKLNGDDVTDDNLFAILQDNDLSQISLESTKGMKGSWNNQVFQIQNEDKEVKFELTPENGLIIGRQEWLKKAVGAKVNLSLSTCEPEEFSCNSGQCIPIEKRCDAHEGDCTDFTDEDSSCVFFYGPPKTYNIFQSPLDPRVALRFRFRYIDINGDENSIQVFFRVSLQWRDHRLLFYNLRRSGNTPNRLPTRYLDVLWHPVLNVITAAYEANQKMNSYDMVDNIQLTPLKRGKFTYMDSYEALEYGGDDVLIKLTRAVEISVQCNFQFTTFPFDLQLCLIPVVLSGLGYPEVDKQQLKVFSDPQHLSIYNVDPIRCRTQLLNDSIVRDTVVIAVMIRRRSEGFFLTTLGPCLVLEILGHISLVAFPVDEFYQRASTALSLLIVMASLFSQSVTILPKSASPKAVDVWFFFFTLRFFLFFVAHCMVELHRTRVASSSKKEDRDKRQLDSREEQMKAAEEAKNKERKRLAQFRKHIEERINRFIQNVSLTKKEFEPMDRVARSIVRDVADVAGLTTYVFGVEDVDRHVMVFKKEYPLTEEELEAYKNGEEWDPEKFKEEARLKEQQRLEDEIRTQKLKNDPGSNKFIEKYERLVGKETGKEAARILEVNKQFGFVRSELKKDKRTIEETLADIRAKKLKRDHSEAADEEKDDNGQDASTNQP